MAKACSDNYMDAMLDLIATADTLTVCSGEPANVAGIAAVTLAAVAVTPGDGNGDFVIANGDTNGRKLTTAQQSAISITSSGTATHVVLDDGTNLYVTTCTSQVLTSGGTVTVPAWDIEVADPS
jgi:hypothetical protein